MQAWWLPVFFLSITLAFPQRTAWQYAHLGLTAFGLDSLNAGNTKGLSGGLVSSLHDQCTIYLDLWK